MNRKELSEVLALMAALPLVGKPDNVADKTTFDAYALVLSDLDAADVKEAVRRHIMSSRFWPTVAELREAVLVAKFGIPSVAAAVNEVAAARLNRWTDLESIEFSHPLVREAALEVGAGRIAEEWGFAHRELEQTYERLRRTMIEAANEAARTGVTPSLPGRLPIVALGFDPFEKPVAPALSTGQVFSGWNWNATDGKWRGVVQSAAWLAYIAGNGDVAAPPPGELYRRDVEADPLHLDAVEALPATSARRPAFGARPKSSNALPGAPATQRATTQTGAEPR